MRFKEKKGITLLVLIITIIVIVIIAGAVISNLDVTTENANLSNFANNILQIQDSARSMYILENKLPVVSTAQKLTKEDLLELVDAGNQSTFLEELNENGEGKKALFYVVDLNKAGADKTAIGSGKDGKDDIYVISINSLKVYYLRGIEYDYNTYFSINSKLAKIVNLPVTQQDSSEVIVKTFQAVTVTKSNKGYTKDLEMKIIANIDLGENLKIGYKGINEKTLLLPEGQTIIDVNNLEDLNVYLDEQFSQSELNTFNSLKGNDRVITFTKYYNNENIGSIEIDISSYDNAAPTIEKTFSSTYSDFNLVTFHTDDTNGIASSGIAFVQYYIGGDESNLNSVKVDENGNFSVKIPTNTDYKIMVTDKVGNYTELSGR